MCKLCTFFLFLSLFFTSSLPTFAHPLDETGDIKVYDQTQKLLFTPEKTTLTIDLTFYPTEKITVWESIDSNRDQKLTGEEKTTWMKKGQEASWLEKDGEKTYFQATQLVFPDYYDFFGQKTASVSILFTANKVVKDEGRIEYWYEGKDKKLEEIPLEVTGANGLQVEELQKKSSDHVLFHVREGSSQNTNSLAATGNNRLNSFLNTYVKAEKVPTNLLLFAFGIAFSLGALHALTPGHGKAIVASYLVGSKGTMWHAINLGLIVTITHTASVFLLGLASILLAEYIVAGRVVTILNTVSGILVLMFGLYLIIKRAKNLKYDKQEERQEHEHTHTHDGHTHSHTHDHDLTWKNLLPLGISGGIVPCIDALAILIVAISLQKTMLGLMLLIFFSLGLATALIAIGCFAVLAKGEFQKRFANVIWFERYISLISAIVVTLLGIGILANIGI